MRLGQAPAPEIQDAARLGFTIGGGAGPTPD